MISEAIQMPIKESANNERTAKMVLYFGIFSIVMLFAGLISAYIVSSFGEVWVDVKLPTAFYISTLLILLSSLTIKFAARASGNGNEKKASFLLVLTVVLGTSFVISQFYGWKALTLSGSYFSGSVDALEGTYGQDYTIDLAGFLQEYDNTVEYLFGIWGNPAVSWPFAGFKFVNTGSSRITGVDFSVNMQAKWSDKQSFTMIGGYTFILPVTTTPDYIYATDYANRDFSYNSTSIDADNQILKYRFQHTFKLDMQYDFSKYFVGMSARYFSKMNNMDNSIFEFEQLTKDINSVYLPPILYEDYYTSHGANIIFDARMGWNINARNRISLISNNVLNRMYSLRPLKAEEMQSITLQYIASF